MHNLEDTAFPATLSAPILASVVVGRVLKAAFVSGEPT